MSIVEQIEIIPGYETWITFRNNIETEYDLSGTVYRNPTMSSWRRLLRLMSDKTKIEAEFIPDDSGMVIRGWRK